MDQLKVDLGIEEFDLGCGVLRFNPADPNLYARFLDLEPQLENLQQALSQKTARATDAAGLIKALAETDRQLKDLLTQVFGEENDFSKLLRGINLLSAAGNGLSVAENSTEARARPMALCSTPAGSRQYSCTKISPCCKRI